MTFTYHGNGALNKPLLNLNQILYSIKRVYVLNQKNGPTRLLFGSLIYSKYSLDVTIAEKPQIATLAFNKSDSAPIQRTYFMKKLRASTERTKNI